MAAPGVWTRVCQLKLIELPVLAAAEAAFRVGGKWNPVVRAAMANKVVFIFVFVRSGVF